MRILFFYQYFTTPKGSWSTRAYEFARRWVADGDCVTVVTSVYDKSDLDPKGFVDRLEVEGIDVRVVNVKLSNKHGKLIRLSTFFWFALVSSWYALTQKADVVLASSGPITVGLPALVARYFRRRPLVFEVRDLWPEGAIQMGLLRSQSAKWLARRLEAVCYRAAHTIVALSDGMRDDILRRFPTVDVEVVPNSCDGQLFGRAVSPASAQVAVHSDSLVLYTGTLGRMDDCMQILRAAEVIDGLGRSSVKFVFLGDGSERAELERHVIEKGLSNVVFQGLVPKTEVVKWLHEAACSVVVFRNVPVLDTCSPNKMFDALAAGVPVIQNTQGWIKELVEREGCGLTVPQEDPVAMAKAILAVVDDEALRKRLAENSLRVADQIFNRDALAEKMRAILVNAAKA